MNNIPVCLTYPPTDVHISAVTLLTEWQKWASCKLKSLFQLSQRLSPRKEVMFSHCIILYQMTVVYWFILWLKHCFKPNLAIWCLALAVLNLLPKVPNTLLQYDSLSTFKTTLKNKNILFLTDISARYTEPQSTIMALCIALCTRDTDRKSNCDIYDIDNYYCYTCWFFARDVCNIYISRLCYDVSVRLSVTEVHCGHGACREEGRGHLALC